MKKQALEYLHRGWSVIPLQPRSKFPDGPWAQYHNRLPRDSEINTWFHEDPDRNIGIVTGKISGIVVVDFDPKRGGDHVPFLRQYPTGRIVRTGGGGVHAYYALPDDTEVANYVDVGGRVGIDIRGTGGMVAGPPSVHSSGGTYEWEEEGPMALFPLGILPAMEYEGSRNERGWELALLENGAPDGQRDDSCTKLAGLFHTRGMTRDLSISVLKMWNEKNRPPLPESDLVKCVESVFRKAKATEARESVASKTREPSAGGFQLMEFGRFMSAHCGESTDWIVPGWLPSRSIAFVISPPGTYKTWSILDLAVSVATGAKFMGMYDVLETGPVVVIQQEDYAGQTNERLSVICNAKFKTGVTGDGDEITLNSVPEVPIYFHTERRLRFDDVKAMGEFRAKIIELKPKLVILDPLYSAGSTEDFMAKTAENMMIFKDLRDLCGTTFMVCHHTKKSGGASERDRLWGSQFLNAFLETGWQLSLEGEKTVRFHRHFKAAANPNDSVLQFDIGTDPNEVYRYQISELGEEEVAEMKAIAPPASGDVLADYLHQNRGQFFTMKELQEQTNIARPALSKKLAQLMKERRVVQHGTAYGSPALPDPTPY